MSTPDFEDQFQRMAKSLSRTQKTNWAGALGIGFGIILGAVIQIVVLSAGLILVAAGINVLAGEQIFPLDGIGYLSISTGFVFILVVLKGLKPS